ncbi:MULTISPECIES: flavin reductase family protein [unclassified Nocardioides]|uniref:flavin reductase family protein n=1 Tax=unclassified Nocardioides TaxID=2615069 RepID=UPI0013FDE838|nr:MULTISPECIES: flavin reductase family protein [unclassified Nocardioides]
MAIDEESPHPDADVFRDAFRLHPSGVAVITGMADDQPVAMTVSSLVPVSAAPPVVVVSLSKDSYATQQLLKTDSLVAHLLSSENRWLAELGARGRTDRFADKDLWQTLPTGEPLYKGVHAWLRMVVVDRTEVGSAVVCVGEVTHIKVDDCPPDQSPLVYHSRNWHRLSDASLLTFVNQP